MLDTFLLHRYFYYFFFSEFFHDCNWHVSCAILTLSAGMFLICINRSGSMDPYSHLPPTEDRFVPMVGESSYRRKEWRNERIVAWFLSIWWRFFLFLFFTGVDVKSVLGKGDLGSRKTGIVRWDSDRKKQWRRNLWFQRSG